MQTQELTPDRPSRRVQVQLDPSTLAAISEAAEATVPPMRLHEWIKAAIREKLNKPQHKVTECD